MKYYKFFNLESIVNTLSDEIVNVSYNKKYFVNNVIQDEIEEEYNTYVSNGISYNFEIIKGNVIFLVNKKLVIGFYTRLTEEIKRKVQLICDKFGYEELDNFYINNYHVDKQLRFSKNTIKLNNVLKEKMFKSIDIQIDSSALTAKTRSINYDKITWYIQTTFLREFDHIMDITDIVVDGFNIFNLEDGYKSINNFTKDDTYLNTEDRYCKINVFNRVKTVKSITKFDQYLITNYLLPVSKDPNSILYRLNVARNLYLSTIYDMPTRNGIYWIKYENTNLINFQIGSAELKYISIDKLPKFNPKVDNLYCALTKIPIYDDFYVLDIYEQTIFSEKNFNNPLTESDKKKIKEYEKMGYVRHVINAQNGHCDYRKIIKFDKPMQIAIHPILINNMRDFVLTHLNTWNVKYILYRTKYNKDVHDIIEQFDINKAHKKLLHSEMNTKKLQKYNFKCVVNNNIHEINKYLVAYTEDVIYEIKNIEHE